MPTTDVRAACERWLKERWSGVYTNSHGALIVPNQTHTACFVDVDDLPDGHTRVNVHAPILVNITPSPDLFQFVALHATTWRFGALSLYEEDGLNVEFDFALPSEGLTRDTMIYVIEMIGATAEDLIGRLQPRFGGNTVR